MQTTVETALKQLQNSREDVVDRTLVANLLVSYLSRRRPREVLQVLSKILNFNESQMVDVGLKVAPTNIVDSILRVMAPKVERIEIEGDNLAELLVNFLIEESGDHSRRSSTSSSSAQLNAAELSVSSSTENSSGSLHVNNNVKKVGDDIVSTESNAGNHPNGELMQASSSTSTNGVEGVFETPKKIK
jgi:GRAB domain